VSEPLVILGAGAFAEEVHDIVLQAGGHDVVAFAVNEEPTRTELRGLPVTPLDDLRGLAATHLAVCAIGTNRRRRFLDEASAAGFGFATVRHPSAVVFPSATVEPGCILGAGVVVSTETRIGGHTILNRGALVGHHTTVGSVVTISPGANIGGRARIGDGAYIAMGAIVRNDITVGEGAVVSAGAVVVRDVPPHTRVVGVPARAVEEGVDGL
jgi:sugar O-acyltransferase (sialic acid O-acetyltransferase NeuD family)